MPDLNRQWCIADVAGDEGLALSREQPLYCEGTVPTL